MTTGTFHLARLEFETDRGDPIGLNGDRFGSDLHVWMPRCKRVGAWRQGIDRKATVAPGNGIIGVVYQEGPALHEFVHAANHLRDSRGAHEVDGAGLGRLDGQRLVEDDVPFLGLIDLNVMDDRVLVDHSDLLMVLDHGHQGGKGARHGMKLSFRMVEVLSSLNPLN